MRGTFKTRFIPRNIKAAFVLFLFVHLSSLFYIPLWIDKDIYKNYLEQKISNLIQYKVSFDDFTIYTFPNLSVSFKNFVMRDNRNYDILYIDLENIHLIFSWDGFLKRDKVIFKKIDISNGDVNVNNFVKKYSSPSSSDDSPIKNPKLLTENILKLIEQNVEAGIIFIRDVNVTINDVTEHVPDNIYVNDLTLKFPSFSNIVFKLNAKYMNGVINSVSYVNINTNDISKVGYTTTTNISGLSLKFLSLYLPEYKNIIWGNSFATGKIQSFKLRDSSLINFTTDLRLNQFTYKNIDKEIHSVSPFVFNGKASINYSTSNIEPINFNGTIGDAVDGHINGNVFYGEPSSMLLHLYLSRMDVKKTIDLLNAFSTSSSSNGKVHVILYSNKIIYDKYHLDKVRADVLQHETFTDIDLKDSQIYKGNLSAIGRIDSSQENSLVFDVKVDGVDAKILSSELLEKSIIQGRLESILRLQTHGKDSTAMKNNFFSMGNVVIKDGIISDKANFLKPVFSLDKIITLKKTDTNFSSFKNMQCEYSYENSHISIRNFKFSGMGLIANGKADVSSDNNITAKITVSFPGIAGKALKIPIVYNSDSILPFEIDRVWMASVYAGTFFLTGHTGIILGATGAASTLVGGIAGSTVSDDLDSGWGKIKKLFSSKEDKTQ